MDFENPAFSLPPLVSSCRLVDRLSLQSHLGPQRGETHVMLPIKVLCGLWVNQQLELFAKVAV